MNVSQGPQAGYISRISSEMEVIEPRYSLSKSGVYGETPIKRITAFLAAVLGMGMATFALASAVITSTITEYYTRHDGVGAKKNTNYSPRKMTKAVCYARYRWF